VTFENPISSKGNARSQRQQIKDEWKGVEQRLGGFKRAIFGLWVTNLLLHRRRSSKIAETYICRFEIHLPDFDQDAAKSRNALYGGVSLYVV
jgi:hypothetical protein